MNLRRIAITIPAAAGFLVLLAGAGLPGTTGPDSHRVHHPEATQGKGQAVSACMTPSPPMGGMMSGMMDGMMKGGTMSETADGEDSPSGCGSAAVPSPPPAPCDRVAAHACAKAASAS